MLRIGNHIFSFDILEKKFTCDLPECHGSCCRYGDSGAPLKKEEVKLLEGIWSRVKPFLRPEGICEIEAKGTSITDFENDDVTPLIRNEDCAYSIIENSVLMCGIEKAYHEGRIDFRKPLSCHLFPLRVKQFHDFTAVNYESIPVCRPACLKGEREGRYVYEFLEEPMRRAFGDRMYNELCIAAQELRNSKR